ncbi:hypothetical protein AGDE_13719 [Angomonas deanei]|nr:hypothetical protein AGDE_13719 [Angomonas deanei]|eukprot:EPY21893.1 hypothetical protein AGDE_13719 [Angomonas deanei]
MITVGAIVLTHFSHHRIKVLFRQLVQTGLDGTEVLFRVIELLRLADSKPVFGFLQLGYHRFPLLLQLVLVDDLLERKAFVGDVGPGIAKGEDIRHRHLVFGFLLLDLWLMVEQHDDFCMD